MSKLSENKTPKAIIINMLLAAFSLFINGLGIYLTIRANIGVSPWDVLNLGVSKTFGILYGNASVLIAVMILVIDVMLKEPIGISMVIDSIVVGKSVDFFNYLNIAATPKTLIGSIAMMIVGLFIIGYTQYTYMMASLGCGPRDTLLVALKKRIKSIPIGIVSVALLVVVTTTGYFLGGQVGIGTVICAFLAGPIMQLCFDIMHFDATRIKHQNIPESIRILFGK